MSNQTSAQLKRPKPFWVWGGLVVVALGIVILAAPSQWEGPVLLPISPGHGLSVLDMFGVAPLILGTGRLYVGLWQRRGRLIVLLQQSPITGGLGVFIAGLGMGLLIASSFSAFWWWWAIGAILFSIMFIAALNVAA
jgi:hypothetical protein